MRFPPVIFVEDHRNEKAPVISHRSYPIVGKVVALWLAAIIAIATILVFRRRADVESKHSVFVRRGFFDPAYESTPVKERCA